MHYSALLPAALTFRFTFFLFICLSHAFPSEHSDTGEREKGTTREEGSPQFCDTRDTHMTQLTAGPVVLWRHDIPSYPGEAGYVVARKLRYATLGARLILSALAIR